MDARPNPQGGNSEGRLDTDSDRPRFVRSFAELGQGDTATAGGKGANLGELQSAGLPVPPGFVVTADAYLLALDEAGVRADLTRAVADLDDDDSHALQDASALLREKVRRVPLPAAVRTALLEAYSELGADVRVAVRSSATSEDSAEASFAGMNETFTNVFGADALVEAVQGCWASLWGARAIAYRIRQGFDEEPAIAVVVQAMVASDRSGVMFTTDPTTGASDRMLIESAYGLGEVVVGGQVEPDTFVLQKPDLEVLRQRVGSKKERIVRTAEGETREDVPEAERAVASLSTAEVRAVGQLGLDVETHYGQPMDVEWAFEGGALYVLQARPITTLGDKDGKGTVLLTGLGASAGRVAGHARILHDPTEGGRLEAGEILVATMTSPDWVPVLRRAAALVTDGGGATCHAAIVSRELGIPCIVGTGDATQKLRDGTIVTVDGASGEVLLGDLVGARDAAHLTAAGAPAAGPGAQAAPASSIVVAPRE
ncbi:MAG TPA: PEP/pyruvate-binding domain-containing protein, partial [Polyangiaceae bacterium LLY-WYZ-15_(1-7)]|nr:PEP/pyruvate-binding domain-containing protein [Polyangiaceae bacterium LLY-WYZ-15_(1-7)]